MLGETEEPVAADHNLFFLLKVFTYLELFNCLSLRGVSNKAHLQSHCFDIDIIGLVSYWCKKG